MKATPVTPSLMRCERDSDERIVGLVYDSTPALHDADVNPWLVAVDSSDNALRAVAHAAQLAHDMRVCALHLIHVQPWLSKEAAEVELAHRALDATARARAKLDGAGLPWRLHVVMGDPAECILDGAGRFHVTAIVIGSRGRSTVENLLLGSVAYTVVHRATLPVVVVP